MKKLKNMGQLESKLQDFKNYAVILTAISTFLYIGIFLKGSQLPKTSFYIVISAMIISLIFAFLFFASALECKKKLNDSDGE